MDLEEYISLLENPEGITSQHIHDLREMLRYAPYCANTRLLLLKGLHKTNDINYTSELPGTLLYAQSPRALYRLLFGGSRQDRWRTKHGGDYFDMLDTLEKTRRQTNESLQELAERLRQARLMLQQPEGQPGDKVVEKPSMEMAELSGNNASPQQRTLEISEEAAKKCIRAKKYAEAIEILEQLSLINPKKKSIFADQIRFLKKIIQ